MPILLPPRHSWDSFPEVVLHSEINVVKQHPMYAAAKSGDSDAALQLVRDTLSSKALDALRAFADLSNPVLMPVHALEDTGVNAIPFALAEELASRLQWRVETTVVQANLVGHTGASGFHRLANQAYFQGSVTAGSNYVLVDDFVGQGGTLANLRGHLLTGGAGVVGATVLTGKLHSVKLALLPETLADLRSKHGQELEAWWHARFGHAFDGLTESEARYLFRTPNADRVRDRIVTAEHG